MVNIQVKDIITKQNDGRIGNYVNACFWISVKHSLKKLGYKVKVSSLRRIAGYTGGKTDMLDFSDYNHKEEVDKLLDALNISIALFVVKDGKTVHNVSLMGKTFGRIIVPILYYEFTHFEAIINQPLRYGVNTLNSDNQKNYFSLPVITFSK